MPSTTLSVLFDIYFLALGISKGQRMPPFMVQKHAKFQLAVTHPETFSPSRVAPTTVDEVFVAQMTSTSPCIP